MVSSAGSCSSCGGGLENTKKLQGSSQDGPAAKNGADRLTLPFKPSLSHRFHTLDKFCHISTICRCNPVFAHLCSSGVWLDHSIRCNAIHCPATDSCQFWGPKISTPGLESIHEHAELRLEAKLLLSAKRLAGFEQGLAEQLSLVKDLPPEEQFETACSLAQAWRPQLSYFS